MTIFLWPAYQRRSQGLVVLRPPVIFITLLFKLTAVSLPPLTQNYRYLELEEQPDVGNPPPPVFEDILDGKVCDLGLGGLHNETAPWAAEYFSVVEYRRSLASSQAVTVGVSCRSLNCLAFNITGQKNTELKIRDRNNRLSVNWPI